MARAYCAGTIVTDVSGVPVCQDTMGAPLEWQSIEDFDPSQIDPLVAGPYFAAGFILVATCWAIGKGVGMLLTVIRR